MHSDTPIFQGQRKQLCEHLKSEGYASDKVLDAMNRVPRHLFLESGFHQHAYQEIRSDWIKLEYKDHKGKYYKW